MEPKIFTPDQFTPTEFSTALDKAKFANQFVKFAESSFERSKFPKWFYIRLSMTFGHIAHYNQEGFYSTFFDDDQGIINFIDSTLRYPCYGHPAFTFSDVEKAIQNWVRSTNLRELHMSNWMREVESRERAELARLKEKYEHTD